LSSANNAVIRAAELKDAPALAELMCQLGYETTPEQMALRLKSILAEPRYQTFIATVDGAVCGMIGMLSYPSYEHDDPSGRIVVLVVSHQARRRGIGRKLVVVAEKEFSRRGITRIAVNTKLTRLEAHKFYEALGFERNGYRFLKKIA
jgi:ribosomal protein S18 acetylase RimI-like enzyme